MLACAALTVSCAEGVKLSEPVDENADVMSFTVDATLAAATGEGMKTVIAADDILRIRFVDASGNVIGRTQMLANTTGEGASATFGADAIAVPDGAQKVVAFLDNKTTSTISYGLTPKKADFLVQDGSLKCAQGLQIISGEASLGGKPSVDLKYATTIVKAEVSYPEGVEPKVGETTITLAVNEIGTAIIGDEITGEKEDITVDATVDEANKTASAYIAVLVKDLVDGSLCSNIGSTKYGCDVKASEIKAGATTTFNVQTEVLVYNFTFDSASHEIDGVAGTILESNVDWITLNGGKLVIAENKSGVYRKGSVLMSNYKTYNVEQSQFKVADFAGKYSFYSYTFKALSNTTIINNANREHVTAVEFVPVANPEELNGHVHNLDLVGLYYDFKLPVSIEFTEAGASINMYLSKDFQKVNTGSATQTVAIIPELTNSTSYSTGYFAPTTFGPNDCNYCWVGWGVDTDNHRFTLGSGDQRKVSDSRWFCGFSCVLEGYTAYTTIYQLNYKNKWVFDINTGGAYFQKVAE